jgi:hypothetical protein
MHLELELELCVLGVARKLVENVIHLLWPIFFLLILHVIQIENDMIWAPRTFRN